MSVSTMVFPVFDDPEALEWLASFDLHPRGRALRQPTLGELRAAVRATQPLECPEGAGGDFWRVSPLYGPVTVREGGGLTYEGGGFELSAQLDIEPADPAALSDDLVVAATSFRGWHDEHCPTVVDAIVAAIGPVFTVDTSSGEPVVHGDD